MRFLPHQEHFVFSFHVLSYQNLNVSPIHVVRNCAQNAETFTGNDVLPKKIDQRKDWTIPYAIFNGNVKALQKPLIKSSNEEHSGVLRTITVIEHKIKWSFLSRHWYESSEETDTIKNVIPFGLYDGIDKKLPVVRIMDALDCSVLPSNIKTEKFVSNADLGFSSSIKSWLDGERLKGVQFIEKMLTEDTPLTAIGELRYDKGSSELKLASPSNGLPLILSTGSVASLTNELKNAVFFLKVFVVLSGTVSLFLLSKYVRKYFRVLRKKWQAAHDERKMKELLAARRKMNRQSNEDEEVVVSQCAVCISNRSEIIVLECGHFCLCVECAETLMAMPQASHKCPICRLEISRTVPVFIS